MIAFYIIVWLICSYIAAGWLIHDDEDMRENYGIAFAAGLISWPLLFGVMAITWIFSHISKPALFIAGIMDSFTKQDIEDETGH